MIDGAVIVSVNMVASGPVGISSILVSWPSFYQNELYHEETCFLHMQKQRRRSAARYRLYPSSVAVHPG